jgi:integrase/recombinase XerC
VTLVPPVAYQQGFIAIAIPVTDDDPSRLAEALLETIAQDQESERQTDRAEGDLARILTALLAGVRADELHQADIRTTDDGAVIHVKGKGGTDAALY